MHQWPHCPVWPPLAGQGSFDAHPGSQGHQMTALGLTGRLATLGLPSLWGPTSPRNTPDHTSRSQERHSRSRPAH